MSRLIRGLTLWAATACLAVGCSGDPEVESGLTGVDVTLTYDVGLDQVVLVQSVDLFMARYRAPVYNCLPIVFTGGFQPVDFPQSIGRREKTYMTDQPLYLGTFQRQGPILDQARIGKPAAPGQVLKIIPVQRA